MGKVNAPQLKVPVPLLLNIPAALAGQLGKLIAGFAPPEDAIGLVAVTPNTPVLFKVTVPPAPSVIEPPPDKPVPAVTVIVVFPCTDVFAVLPYITDQFDTAALPF